MGMIQDGPRHQLYMGPLSLHGRKQIGHSGHILYKWSYFTLLIGGDFGPILYSWRNLPGSIGNSGEIILLIGAPFHPIYNCFFGPTLY